MIRLILEIVFFLLMIFFGVNGLIPALKELQERIKQTRK